MAVLREPKVPTKCAMPGCPVYADYMCRRCELALAAAAA